MGKLIYSMLTSFDGYTSDDAGDFDWGVPDAETHRFINDRTRSVSTYLYGRRMYETMVYWETAHLDPGATEVELDFARVWQAADKVVYSSTLPEVSTARTRLERSFDPESVRRLKEEADGDLTIDGPTLAAHALRAGLVDEIAPNVTPVAVGGGTRFLPDGVRLDLELLEEHRLGGGISFLRYRVLPR